MDEQPDYELQHATPPSPSRPPKHRIGLWILVILFAAAFGAAAYFAFFWQPPPPLASVSAAKPAAVAIAKPPLALGGTAEPIEVPPLDQTDPLVRRLVRELSTEPAVVAWLMTPGLIRTFTVVVVNLAEGTSPAKFLTVLRPGAGFTVIHRDGRVYIDLRSYDRYAAIAAAVGSIDPTAAARLYATLKPRIQDAYRDLGFPDRPFDRTLERATIALLKTPIADGPVQLTRKSTGIGYAFAEERLEDLTAAQKHLLRMGPRNGRVIKGQLRRIAAALGMPSNELPLE